MLPSIYYILDTFFLITLYYIKSMLDGITITTAITSTPATAAATAFYSDIGNLFIRPPFSHTYTKKIHLPAQQNKKKTAIHNHKNTITSTIPSFPIFY